MSLGRHLDVQQRVVEQLLQLLEQERLALAQGRVDAERLRELVAGKQAALLRLEQLEAMRATAQLKLGYGPGREGALRAARDADCLSAWRRLRQSALRARALNRVNGEALGLRLKGNQQILDFLDRITADRLYGPNGLPVSSLL
ncbi:flagellar export chaperone FlgN [Pseudomonas putida]|jgi:flagella synthesis protein FlgN|uniref:Flagellar protein FlgN n=1 Tax=Pseudomonas putida TaxID=303 RepID=A0A7Y8CZT9_PSEPU|nr:MULTISPECIES: flagellar export chaperone FlgN [Pseudomonas]QPN45707.1 flagellar protein FlgN [Priestia aryabhattai]KAF1313061.1 flagellar protein FlgN [Pseudomonas sp. SG-MS2]MBG6125257.1 flagella synthesis protein FlgN [Pseudomonas sp. M2]NSX18636.1 flagellar protein FlgN [Pseudomonas putida]NWC78724.1 flagellar protein FlgN [Pseudomonas putida]